MSADFMDPTRHRLALPRNDADPYQIGPSDTERLNWLEQNPNRIYPQAAVYSNYNIDGFHDEEDGWADDLTKRWYRDFREAIDEAMRAQPGA